MKLYAKELKFYDTAISQVDITASGTVVANTLVDIAGGTGESDRVGRKITVTNIMLQGRFNLPVQTSLGHANSVKCFIYLDKQCNKAAATYVNIYGTSPDIYSFKDLENSKRFRILKEVKFSLNQVAAEGNGTTKSTAEHVRLVDMYHQCNLEITFASGTGALNQITQNNIGIMAITSSDATDKMNFKGNVRIRYTG